MGQIISGQVQGAFDPSSIDGGGPTFVIYTWTTAGVWSSQDGTPGTFEPCSSYAVGWRQGQASTSFQAQFFAPGQYLLEVACTATVYSQSDGSVVASFTGTGYIGGSASDIDTGGGSGGQAHKAQGKVAHALKAHAGGGDGISILPATVTFDKTSLKLGLGSVLHHSEYIGATVTPFDQVGSVGFTALNNLGLESNEVNILIANQNPVTGQVSLLITAAGPTPVWTGGSPDCTIVATVPAFAVPVTVASATALVFVPKTCTETPSSGSQDDLLNMFFSDQSQVPPDWDVATQDNFVLFASHVYKNITITIYDQFGNPLDAIYDAPYVVDETTTGADPIPNLPVKYPSGKLSNGVILDEVSVTDPVELATTFFDLGNDEKTWYPQDATLPGPNGLPYYVTTFAYHQNNNTYINYQTLSVGGYTLSPTWKRKVEVSAGNVSLKKKPGSTIMKVTITAVPGT